jgi:hypothetical protein
MATEPGISAPHQVYSQPLAPVYGDGAPRPPVGPASAVARHPIIFLLVLLLCAGGGVALGITRKPIYTAEARLNVGSTDISNNALPSYVVATQTLAANYSRAIDSQQVVTPLARSLHRSPEWITAHISASPVPESSVIRVEARGPDSATSSELANDASRSLARYASGLEVNGAANDALLKGYRAAVLDQTRAEQARRSLVRRYSAAPTANLRSALRQATATLRTAQLRVDALGSQYQNSQQQERTTSVVQPLTSAAVGHSDFRSALAVRAFTGAVAGLLLGAALVTLIANRRRLRAG